MSKNTIIRLLFFILYSLSFMSLYGLEDYHPPKEVRVLPVFFVPKGEKPPTKTQTATLMRHLQWTREQFKTLLKERDTFTLAGTGAEVYSSKHDLAFYHKQPEGGAPQMVSELLNHYKHNRFNCPGIFVTVVINPREDFPIGGGRPFNGGFNTGGGIVQLSTYALDQTPNFQSTLIHELGHAFGLPHIDVYGYDQKTNSSIMSYNRAHHTRGFDPSPTPGTLIPEDLRALAFNKRVFPRYSYDPILDCSVDYRIASQIVWLGPMKIPGQPDGVQVKTSSGEAVGSKVGNIVQGRVLPNSLPPALIGKAGASSFDGRRMWHSDTISTGSATVEVTFPGPVELSAIAIHSQHSGKYHIAEAVKIAAAVSEEAKQVVDTDLKSADHVVRFAPTVGKVWTFFFQPGQSQMVVIRGLRFFSGDDEIFPTLVPYPS